MIVGIVAPALHVHSGYGVQAAHLSRQLRAAWPHTRILVGIWGFRGDAQRALNLFRASPLWKEGEDHFATTLAEAMAHLAEPA